MLSFPKGDEVVVVRVEGLADRRGPYEEARHLYTDLTGPRADTAPANGWGQALVQKPPLTPALASF